MPFHFVLQTNFSSGAFSGVLVPAVFPRVGTEADAWAHFRVLALKFRLHPVGGITASQVFGFVGGVQDTPPATIATGSEVLSSIYFGGDTTVPSEWCSVPKLDLAGPLPWYKTVAGTTDATEESPGWFFGAGSGSDSLVVEFRGLFEFKTSLATANTPVALQARQLLRQERVAAEIARERDLLLKILAGIPGGGQAPASSALAAIQGGGKP